MVEKGVVRQSPPTRGRELKRLKKEIGAAKKLSQTQGLQHQGNAIPAVTTEALKSSRELTTGSIPKLGVAGNGAALKERQFEIIQRPNKAQGNLNLAGTGTPSKTWLN